MKASKQDGGRVIGRARIVLVFMGNGWTPAGLPLQGDAEAMFRATLATPYMSYLAQYEGICRAEIVATHKGPTEIGILAPDPRHYIPTVQLISDKEITDAFGANIDANPRPAGEQTLYMAIISSSTQPVLSAHTDAGGYHSVFEHEDRLYDWGVVLNFSGNTEENIWGDLAVGFTHELVEACTDPDGSSGYRLTPAPNPKDPGENELCDYAPKIQLRLPGLRRDLGLESYWSNVHDRWVAPTGYSVRAALGQQAPQSVPDVWSALGTTRVRAAVRARCT
jgi:hypothetical protein